MGFLLILNKHEQDCLVLFYIHLSMNTYWGTAHRRFMQKIPIHPSLMTERAENGGGEPLPETLENFS